MTQRPALVTIPGLVDPVLVSAVGFCVAESEAALAAHRVTYLKMRAVTDAADDAPVLDADLPQPRADPLAAAQPPRLENSKD